MKHSLKRASSSSIKSSSCSWLCVRTREEIDEVLEGLWLWGNSSSSEQGLPTPIEKLSGWFSSLKVESGSLVGLIGNPAYVDKVVVGVEAVSG